MSCILLCVWICLSVSSDHDLYLIYPVFQHIRDPRYSSKIWWWYFINLFIHIQARFRKCLSQFIWWVRQVGNGKGNFDSEFHLLIFGSIFEKQASVFFSSFLLFLVSRDHYKSLHRCLKLMLYFWICEGWDWKRQHCSSTCRRETLEWSCYYYRCGTLFIFFSIFG